ncbi:MAG: Fur family transcriptional regulator [Candidatus Dormibacteria bacterium]
MPRPSPIRDRVQELVLGGSRHAWTIDELLAQVRAGGSRGDYSTVFRAVAHLEGEGLIARVELGDGRVRYEPAERHHDHVVCDRCGQVSDSGTDCLLEGAAQHVSRMTGFQVRTHHLVFTGLCADCAPST